MSAHHISLRMVLKILIIGIVGLLITATAHGKTTPPPVAGEWIGDYKIKGEHGPDAKGTVDSTFVQNGSDGTLLATAVSTDGQVTVTITGDFSQARRKLTGLFDLSGDVVDTGTFKGKLNGSGDRLKLKLKVATGGKVKIKLDRIMTR